MKEKAEKKAYRKPAILVSCKVKVCSKNCCGEFHSCGPVNKYMRNM